MKKGASGAAGAEGYGGGGQLLEQRQTLGDEGVVSFGGGFPSEGLQLVATAQPGMLLQPLQQPECQCAQLLEVDRARRVALRQQEGRFGGWGIRLVSSDGRRAGEEWVSAGRFRWAPAH